MWEPAAAVPTSPQGHARAAGSFVPLACFRPLGRAPRAVGIPAIPFPLSTASPGHRPGVGFPSLTNSFLLVHVGSPPWGTLSGMVALHPPLTLPDSRLAVPLGSDTRK